MKINLFKPNGYVDIKSILSAAPMFTWIVGGRGTGKTYGAVDLMEELGELFVYLRRTGPEVDIVMSSELSPFRKWGKDHDTVFAFENIVKNVKAIYHGKIVDGVVKPQGEKIGILGSLTTFAGVRGFDGEEFKYIIYDEFIKEPHVKKIKEEGQAFFNIVETINRNREFDGTPPVKVLLTSNSFEMANPYFVELGFVDRAERMKEKGDSVYFDPRGHLLIVLEDSPISARKSQTALYKALRGTRFADMAIENNFADRDNYGEPVSRKLKGARPICFVGEIAIYQFKDTGRFYVSSHRTGNALVYNNSVTDLQRFRNMHGMLLWRAYMLRMIDFERISFEVVLQTYLNKA